MKKQKGRILFAGCFILLLVGVAHPQSDAKNCKDHPLFTRMPNFCLKGCEFKEFGKVDFVNEKGNDIEVEGKVYRADYWLKEGFRSPGELKILRNFSNAIKEIGGMVVKEERGNVYLKLKKSGKVFWVIVDTSNSGEHYELTIVEKADMAQEVVADAKSLMDKILMTGHASVYGIYFDFNKTEIKPESSKALKEIGKLLRQNPGLKLYVVGHTDNVGKFAYNMKLSRARAEAVVRTLVDTYHVASQRLAPYGVGPLAPVASNKSEEGRAKNRRVELVEK
ncbi:MAG: OmpA family protein [Deltaproteobacteria bacterium]|nr:OmpA family protein [Deltaproteobacteria bacterium]